MQGASAFPGGGIGGTIGGGGPPLTNDVIIPGINGIGDAIGNLGSMVFGGISSFFSASSGVPGFDASGPAVGGFFGGAFANGGGFTVPGPDTGRDDQLVSFAARGGEEVEVRTKAQARRSSNGDGPPVNNINISRLIVNSEQKDNMKRTNPQIDRKATLALRRGVNRGI
jgi:hypothetical protein